MTCFTNCLFKVYNNLSFKKTGPEVYNNIVWFCKAFEEPAKKAIIEDKCIEDRCKEYTKKKINEKLRSLEVDLQNKTDSIEMEKLQ